MENRLVRDAVAEFIGTFMLVLVGAGAVTVAGITNASAGLVIVAFAHGLILLVIVATFGHISGAHVNPAVTLGLLVGRKVNVVRAVVYWVAQFAGGIVAALVLRFLFPNAANLGQTVPGNGVSSIQALVLEALMTFFLASTVYQAAIYGKAAAPPAVAIGFTLAACILFGAPLTGASLNPARTLGPGLISGDLTDIVFYMIGMFGGGALAGLLHSTFFKSR